MALDFEDDTDSVLPTDADLKSISAMVSRLGAMKEAISKAELKLKLWKEQYVRLAQVDLPEAMRIAGIAQMSTDDGFKVEVKDEIYASISEKNKVEAHAWLVEHDFGDIIKTDVTVKFGRGEHEKVELLLEELQTEGYQNFNLKEAVHPQTLKAFLREQLAAGKDVPLELFGVMQVKEVVFK
jgi:hypothetical protein